MLVYPSGCPSRKNLICLLPGLAELRRDVRRAYKHIVPILRDARGEHRPTRVSVPDLLGWVTAQLSVRNFIRSRSHSPLIRVPERALTTLLHVLHQVVPARARGGVRCT